MECPEWPAVQCCASWSWLCDCWRSFSWVILFRACWEVSDFITELWDQSLPVHGLERRPVSGVSPWNMATHIFKSYRLHCLSSSPLHRWFSIADARRLVRNLNHWALGKRGNKNTIKLTVDCWYTWMWDSVSKDSVWNSRLSDRTVINDYQMLLMKKDVLVKACGRPLALSLLKQGTFLYLWGLVSDHRTLVQRAWKFSSGASHFYIWCANRLSPWSNHSTEVKSYLITGK